MPTTTPAGRTELRRATGCAVLVALGVLALRLTAYSLTRSVAVLADAVDPLFNLVAAAVTAVGVMAGRRPADEDHPFGHRKLEFVVVGFQGAMVLSGAVIVAVAGTWQVLAGVPVTATPTAIGLFALSMLLNGLVARVLTRAGQTHGSPALRAAGRHARLDVLLAAGVLLNLLLVGRPGWTWLDPAVSAVIVIILARGAWRLLRRSVLGLLDTALPEVTTAAATTLDDAVGGEVLAWHDLRCRDGGGHLFVDFHLQFAPAISLERAHELAEGIEQQVEAALTSADATAHLEPASEVRADRREAPRPLTDRERSRRRAALLSVVAATVIVAVKLAAWAITGSAAILSDALEGLVNVAAAAFAVYSVRYARRAVDATHHYGHHKIEYLAATVEGLLILGAAGAIVLAATPRLLHPLPPARLELGLGLLTAAAAANGLLGAHLIRAGRRLNSLTLEADGHHVLTDVWTSAGVLVGLLLVKLTGQPLLDPLVAILFALLIGATGARLVHRAILGVLDTVDEPTRARAAAILDDQVARRTLLGWHKLRVRDVGARRFVDAHVQFAEGTGLDEAHTVAEALEAALEEELAPASAILHTEPASELHRSRSAPDLPRP